MNIEYNTFMNKLNSDIKGFVQPDDVMKIVMVVETIKVILTF